MKKLNQLISIIFLTIFISGCIDAENDISNEMANPKFTMRGDNISIMFVIDGSGSMGDTIKDKNNLPNQKITIANDALVGVGQSIDRYLSISSNKTVGIGFVRFYDGRIISSLPLCLSSNIAKNIANQTKDFSKVSGSTPLGESILNADKILRNIEGTNKKHIIVLTDGASNGRISTQEAIDSLKSIRPENLYFIALDMSSDTFKNAAKKGATILEARNGNQLMMTFDKLLSEKILLEKED